MPLFAAAQSMAMLLPAAAGDPTDAVMGWLQTSALVAVTAMFAMGWIVSKPTLERLVVGPLQDRIAALERALATKDEQYRDLVKQQAAALEVQSRLAEQLLAELRGVK